MTATQKVLIAAALAAVLCAAAYMRGMRSGEDRVRAQWDAERAAIAQATQQAMQERIAAEEQLRRQADEQQKTYQKKIARLTADRDALLRSVRERPSRDSGGDVPGTAAAGGARCTGAELHREDAEFLVGEAARADRIAEQLSACVAQYDAAREAVKRQNSNAVSQ